MCHYVHQLVANLICLQIAYRGLIRAFFWKQLSAAAVNWFHAAAGKTKIMGWKRLEHCMQLCGTADVCVGTLWYITGVIFPHTNTLIWGIVNVIILIITALNQNIPSFTKSLIGRAMDDRKYLASKQVTEKVLYWHKLTFCWALNWSLLCPHTVIKWGF